MSEMRCRHCQHCTWLNGWRCALKCWEFDIWLGRCAEFEKSEKQPL